MKDEYGNEIKIPKVAFVIGAIVIALVLALSLGGNIIETNPAGWYKVKQAAITGTMSIRFRPGMFAQNFGDITPYRVTGSYWFSKHPEEGGKIDQSVSVRFNDGGTAGITGMCRVNLPNTIEEALTLHRKFRTYDNFMRKGVKQLVDQVVMLTAVLMSSEESYTTKKAFFIDCCRDQLAHGIYQTEQYITETVDPFTGEIVKKARVRIRLDKKTGKPLHQLNPWTEFGVTLQQFVIKELEYEKGVKDLIASKRQALMETVKAKAEAEKAQQQRITAEEEGKKNVMVAKYEKEEEKVRAVVTAQQRLEVAVLDKKAAEQQKQKLILLGQGEGERKRLVMKAEGALQQKLAAYVKVSELYADAIKSYTGDWVPKIVMGENGKGTQVYNGAQQLIQLLLAKTAEDLALDMEVPGKRQTTQ